MRFVLALLALVFNAADNWTTYVCLTTPVSVYDVYEANPLAAWGFDTIGLGLGLWIEMGLCVIATSFLLWSNLLDLRVRIALLALLAILPAGAAVNNLLVMRDLQMIAL